MQKVYWIGRHASIKVGGVPFTSPLGKVHLEGLDILHKHGWQRVEADTEGCIPVFAFTTRKGANFPEQGPGLPTIRQLPQRCTAVLDDKRWLWEVLVAAGQAQLMPPTWPDAEAFLQQHQVPSASGRRVPCEVECRPGELSLAAPRRGVDEGQQQLLPNDLGGTPTWFLKHRLGVKGQAVYFFSSLAALLSKLSVLSAHSRRDFVVQQSVLRPLLTPSGHKFVLQAHVLLLLEPPGQGYSVHAHRDVIVLECPEPYNPLSASRAAHISSCGRSHSQPYLLGQLLCSNDSSAAAQFSGGAAAASGRQSSRRATAGVSGDSGEAPECSEGGSDSARAEVRVNCSSLGSAGWTKSQGQGTEPPGNDDHLATVLQSSIWAQICSAAAASVQAGGGAGLLPPNPDPSSVPYHLLGYDFVVDEGGRVWLLEVNAYPAIASGTMAGVDRRVFTTLIEDLLALVVLPVTDRVPRKLGGFVQVA